MQFKNLVPGTQYRIKAYNPIRDYETIIGEKVVAADGRIDSGTFPVQHDWVIILEQC